MSNFENTKNIVGQRIRKERDRLDISQEELGKMFPVTKQTVSNWENGNRIPDTKTINKLAEIFGVSTDYLLGQDFKRNRSTEAYDFDKNLNKLDPERKQFFHDFTNMSDEDFHQLQIFSEYLKSRKKKKKNKG